MAYYSGQVAGYQELSNALVAACVAEGWAWADSILSKGDTFVKLTVSLSMTGTVGIGLIISAGTGKSGSTLLNESLTQPRLGPLSTNSIYIPLFPIRYHFFIFEDPNEVYVVINFDVTRYFHIAFGSDGLGKIWLSGSAKKSQSDSGNSGVVINATAGGSTATGLYTSGIFWVSNRSTTHVQNLDAVYVDGVWTGANSGSSINAINGFYANMQLIALQPNKWNDETILFPIQILQFVASSKSRILLEMKNSRYLRVDYYEPEQIITLGNDRWMILPFHRKNILAKDGTGSNYGDHSGTFGWAIRYDGP